MKRLNKNIAIICNYILKPNRIGGMDRFFVNFDKKLKKNGYKVDWFFTDYEPFDFYEELTIYSANAKSIEQEFINYSKEKNIHYPTIITHFTELCTSYYKQFKKLNPNSYVIAVDHNPRPYEGVLLKKRIKNKVKGWLNGKYINQFIGVSDYTSDYIVKDYGYYLRNKTRTIHNGIETTICKKQTLDRTKVPFKFIVVSHLRKSKGIQDLLKALSLLKQDQLDNIKIDIYGEGPYKKTLKLLQNEYGLNKIVNFKGSSSNILSLLSNYHYLIQPTYMECFSLSLLESLACNVPVITTTVGGNLEVVKDDENGFIFKPGDINKLKIIIENIVSETKSILLDTSILIEKKFNIEKMVKEHYSLVP